MSKQSARSYDAVPDGCPLTPRELAFLRLLHRGHTREQVAESYQVSANSVQTGIDRARRRLGVRTDSAAVKAALPWILSRQRPRYPTPPPGCLLSPAQLEFVRRQARGQTLQEIERELELAPEVVNQALTRARRRLGVSGRGPLALVLVAAQKGWLEDVVLPSEDGVTDATLMAYSRALDRWLRSHDEATVEVLLGLDDPSSGVLGEERSAIGRAVLREARVIPQTRPRVRKNGTFLDDLCLAGQHG